MFLDILTESQNYHIFGVNMDDRKKHLAKLKEYKQSLYLKDIFSRKKRKRIDAQINYLENFISSNDNHFTNNNKLLLAQLNRELSAGDKSLHTASLNLEIPPVFLRFRSLSGTISHPASKFTIQLGEQ